MPSPKARGRAKRTLRMTWCEGSKCWSTPFDKRERKYHKLKFETADGSASDKPQAEEDGLDLPLLEGDNLAAVTNANWRQGKQLL